MGARRKVAPAADWFRLPAAHAEAALAYYGAFPEEIDARISANKEAAAEAEAIRST